MRAGCIPLIVFVQVGDVGFVGGMGETGDYGDVTGDMAITGAVGADKASQYNTLDEPIKDTIVSTASTIIL